MNEALLISSVRQHELIEQAQNAERALLEADRRKDEFLAILAHELRNPLSPIMLGLELMKTLGDNPARMEKIRGSMERQTRQLIMLVDDLLDGSRVTTGKLEITEAPRGIGRGCRERGGSLSAVYRRGGT
jgi:signal transduction histidine kinase